MKKLFLLIPALALTLMANATKWEIDPTYNPDWSSASQNIEHTIGTNIGDGDTIVLRQGIYVEPYSISINHPVVIMADVNASPVIQRGSYFGAYANVKFIGIKFDGGNTAEYAVYVQNGTTKSIIFEDCEFTGFTKDIITGSSSKSNLDSCVINNCYFHDNVRSAVKFETSSSRTDGLLSCNFLKVTNSTITNVSALSGALIDNRNNGNESGADSLYVDHVTIYNWTGGSNGAIMAYKSHHVEITNCIIAEPADQAYYATYCYGGVVKNCLSYHLTQSTSRNSHKQSTGLSGNFTADPQFVDAAEGNYALSDLSPARNAGTDGSNLGDPRWNAPCSLPHTDFATPYLCSGADATISGNIWRNENKYLYGNGGSKEVYGTAEWRIHATRACAVQVALNMDPDAAASGHVFMVEIFDATDNKVGEVAESGYSSSTVDGIDLSGLIYLPAAGDYRIKLSNSQTYSSAVIKGITLSYVGGAEQAMPGTTNISDAWFSEEGTRADGKIDFPDGHIQDGWVKWNVSFTDAANYNVTVNIDNANGHWYTVALYRSESDESPITVTEGKQMGTIGTLELGAMEVPAGNYILKVTNATQYSDAKLISVNFAYAGGAAVDLSKTTPASLLPNADAILSDDWTIEDGKIVHAESKALTGWAKWNVNSADDGNYNVTVNISSDNGHLVRVEVFEDENEPAIYTLNETATTQWHTGEMAIDLGNIALDNKEYVFKVSNTQSSSHVQIVSIVITYKNGAVQNIPGALTLTDAMLSAKAYIENDMLYFAPHDCGTIPEEWAKWNLHVADADVYQFAVNVTSPNGQKYTIIIEDKDGNEVYNLVQTSSLGSGDRSFTTDMMYLASGDYTLEMRNNYPYSDGHLVSISAAAVADVLTIDENATDNSVIYNNYRNGNHTIRLIRTIKAGMYNTICLPFDVSSSKLPAIFGSDVELKQMSSAELSGDVLNLMFDDATSIYRGTPYLIKTSSDVVNPIFTEVEIKAEVGDATSGTNADFIGNFIKSEVPAGENNLFLGPENLLYFSQTATPIKGMRAYFQLKGINHPQQVIKHARIVMNSQVATAIESVNGANNGSVKTIENGQLIIIRDGVRYNAMGVIIK